MSKALLTDLYQLTMNAAYLESDKTGTCTFDLFVRKLPKNWGYLIAAGLEEVVEYLEEVRFEQEDVDYLRSQNLFSEEFLDSLKDFKFTGDVYAAPEGTVVFGNEPLVRVTAPKMEAQLVETYILNRINFQTMIATKASRIAQAAEGAAVVEFGLRRAQDDAALNASRASYIGGCVGTSNVEAGRVFGIPIKGTHAHSFVMSFQTELDAFRAYVKTFPTNATLLIDTYDVMQGARNAAIVAKELEASGHRLSAVRLDSGDLVEQSKAVRQLFDSQGLNYVKIVASNDLNEYKITEMIKAGARIDIYGVGTDMVVSRDCPALPGVYKLAEDTAEDGSLVAKIKLSEGKRTLPGRKQVHRSSDNGLYQGDTIGLEDEVMEGSPLLVKVMENGHRIYKASSLPEIQSRVKEQLSHLPEEVRRIQSPVQYLVALSPDLSQLSEELSRQYGQPEVAA